MGERKGIAHVFVVLKGMAMGAADIVPGVSGGTIAFITGIYEELINSINNCDLSALRKLFKEGFSAFWKHINGTFLVTLILGVGISLVSLANVISYLLEAQPVLIWSFFFGLIIASVWLVGKSISKWSPRAAVALVAGIAIAFYLSSLTSVAHVEGDWFIFVSGMIAICAMILPGISGSFILVMLGSYHKVLGAIKDKDLMLIALFGAGCVIGLLAFSKVLKFLFSRFKDVTIALLTGFMIGALYKVWPWKNRVGDTPLVVHSDGKEDYLMTNVLPNGFEGDVQIGMAIACAVGGLLLIIVLERFAPKEK
jgi:putative membrane protein